MSTTTPDRVSFQTPRGNIRVGDVVDDEFHATADVETREYRLVVEYEGHRYRVPASEAVSIDR